MALLAKVRQKYSATGGAGATAGAPGVAGFGEHSFDIQQSTVFSTQASTQAPTEFTFAPAPTVASSALFASPSPTAGGGFTFTAESVAGSPVFAGGAGGAGGTPSAGGAGGAIGAVGSKDGAAIPLQTGQAASIAVTAKNDDEDNVSDAEGSP